MSRLLLFVLLAILAVLQYRLWVGEGSLAEVSRRERAVAEQREENARLRARNALLDAEVGDLKQGLESIEDRARHDLGMIHKDEVFFQQVEEPPK